MKYLAFTLSNSLKVQNLDKKMMKVMFLWVVEFVIRKPINHDQIRMEKNS
jgi:hypothetical protein